MNISDFEGFGRRIMVEFTCRRCSKVAIKPLKESIDKDFRENLYDLNPPAGWRNGGFYYPILCPECKNAYDDFMRMEGAYGK